MKKKFITLLACAGFVAASAQLTIKPIDKAPVIDADASDWNGQWIDLTLEKEISTTHDMTAKMQMGYDNIFLYIVTEIVDVTPNTDDATIPNAWERDCVELFFSMDTTTYAYSGNGSGGYREGVWQIRKQRDHDEGGLDINIPNGVNGNAGMVGGGYTWNVNSLTSDPRFETATSAESKSYVLEFKIPWDVLTFDLNAWDNKQFKFDIQVADNTTGAAENGRTQHRYLFNNDGNQHQNTNLFGLVTLEIPIGSVSVKNSSKSNTISVLANSISFANTTKSVSIYSITGKLLLKASDVNYMSTSGLRSGVYFLVTDKETLKFVK